MIYFLQFILPKNVFLCALAVTFEHFSYMISLKLCN